jgi:hypothetical protein
MSFELTLGTNSCCWDGVRRHSGEWRRALPQSSPTLVKCGDVCARAGELVVPGGTNPTCPRSGAFRRGAPPSAVPPALY